jgi:hypothetical protein
VDADKACAGFDKYDFGGAPFEVMTELEKYWEQSYADEIGAYQEKYFRWLRAKQDYPFCSDPEPESGCLSVSHLKPRWAQEFNRRT